LCKIAIYGIELSELQRIIVVLYINNGDYYNAMVEIPGGKLESVPLYVRRGGESAVRRAKEVVEVVRSTIVEQGKVDVPRLVKEGKLPLLDYIDERISEMLSGTDPSTSVQYQTHVQGNTRGKGLGIKLYSGNEEREFASLFITIKNINNNELKSLCINRIEKSLGVENRRTRSGTSPRPRGDHAGDLITSRPTLSFISEPQRGMQKIFLGWRGGPRVGISSKTHSREVAEGRLRGVLELIDTVVADGGAIPISEIREYLEMRGAWRDYHESGKGGRGR
jgi:hypothetical protein